VNKLTSLYDLLLIAALFALCVGCKSGGYDPDTYIEYRISAELDGISTVWDLGITDIEPRAFGQLYNRNTFTGIEIFAATETVPGASPLPDDYIWLDIATTMTAPSTYTETQTYGWIRKDGVYWEFASIYLIIKSFGPIGEPVQGSFFGTVTDGSTDMSVSSGQFDVVRISDNGW
jgi:hypothetical protein